MATTIITSNIKRRLSFNMKSIYSITHQIGVRLLLIFNHILAVIGITYSSLWWYLCIPIGFILFGKIGGEIGTHRYIAHGSFKTTKIKHYLLSTLGMYNCFGSPISWAIAHRTHHINSDDKLDPHSPHIIPWWKVWLTSWQKVELQLKHYADLLKDPIYKNCHKYYFAIIFTTFALLATIDWRLPIFLICIPSCISLHGACLINVVCHMWGYRNFDTPDKSTNNWWANDLTLGSGLHNNHHNDPSNWDENVTGKERDYCGWFIKNYLKI